MGDYFGQPATEAQAIAQHWTQSESNGKAINLQNQAGHFSNEHERWLVSRGYSIQPRTKNSRLGLSSRKEGERLKSQDFLASRGLEWARAVRIDDNETVYLKITSPESESEESGINEFIYRPVASPEPLNHCLKPLEILEFPSAKDTKVLVLPAYPLFDPRKLIDVGDAIDFFRQIIEGIMFLHQLHIAYGGCRLENIVVQTTKSYVDNMRRALRLTSSPIKGTTALPSTKVTRRYHLVDFSQSRGYDPNKETDPNVDFTDEAILPVREDPFSIDVYDLGILIKDLVESREGLDFMRPLISDMTQEHPTRRPKVEDVMFRFESGNRSIDPHEFQRPLISKNSSFLNKLFRNMSYRLRSPTPDHVAEPPIVIEPWSGSNSEDSSPSSSSQASGPRFVAVKIKGKEGTPQLPDIKKLRRRPRIPEFDSDYGGNETDSVRVKVPPTRRKKPPKIYIVDVPIPPDCVVHLNMDPYDKWNCRLCGCNINNKKEFVRHTKSKHPDGTSTENAITASAMAALGIASLVLSLPSLIDNSIDYAKRLHDKMHTFNNAGVILKKYWDEYKIYSYQLEASLVFVKDISQFLSPSVKETIGMTLIQLNAASDVTIQMAERCFDPAGNFRRIWFTIYGKTALEKNIQQINRYHDIFLRSLHYSVLLGGRQIENMMAKHIDRAGPSSSLVVVQNLKEAIVGSLRDSTINKVQIEMEDLPKGYLEPLHFGSNIRYLKPLDHDQNSRLIERHYDNPLNWACFDDPLGHDHKLIERQFDSLSSYFNELSVDHDQGPRIIKQHHDTPNFERGNVLGKYRKLARILSGTSLEMGILPCEGFIAASEYCHFIFRTPPGFRMGKPRTLRQLLLGENGVGPSITERVKLAVTMATAVLYVHAAKLVHKNIRPENILLFEGPHATYPPRLGTAVLMGFDFVRLDEDPSPRPQAPFGMPRLGGLLETSEDLLKKIYLHPERQGEYPEVSYNMLHDIYSLGVVLLEIALWKSFVVENLSGNKATYKPNLQAYSFCDRKTQKLRKPREIQADYIKAAEDLVPASLGEKYRDIVLMCLNSLEGSFEGTVEGMRDVDGVIVGLVFIEKVLGGLKEISV